MKPIKEIIFVLTLVAENAFAQPLSTCANADFEFGNFNNWVAKTGYCFPITMTGTGVSFGRHTIMSAGGNDPYSMGLIPFVPPGAGTHTVRLGNDNVGSEAEQLIYSFNVSASNALFIYRYAVVLEDPGHPAAEQPRFTINVFDQNGANIPCGTYNVVASGNIPGFVNNGDYRIKPWATVGIDLSSYIGQSVRIEFTTADCGYGAHFGYAYMECYCSPFQIFSDFCPGMNIANLQAPIGFASYLWSTGDTTSSIVINNPVNGASYSVTMTSVTGCQVTLTAVLSQSSLFADFYLSTFCANHVSFIDSSYVLAGSPIAQWQWDFGDGTGSSQHFPVHAYADSGTFYVHLTVMNAGGCTDSITIPIVTQPFPHSNFSFATSCPGSPVFFTDLSSFTQGSITDWQWSFGDGDTSALRNPDHLYGNAATHQVALTVTGSNGCIDSTTVPVAPAPVPVASFVPHSGCVNAQYQFTDGSYVSAGTIANCSWDFGDGSAAVSQSNPVHVYTTSGSFVVTLIATASSGCMDTITHYITIRPAPSASFISIPACFNDPVAFSSTSTVSTGSITGCAWHFGDGDSLSGAGNVSHRYAAPGIYNVTLIVKSNYGCTDTITLPALQKDVPEAAFVNTVACPQAPVYFTDSSVLMNGSIVQWSWDFGDTSSLVTFQNPSHTYPGGGNYNIQLIVTGSNGCIDTAVAGITFQPVPDILFNAWPVCQQQVMSFLDSSSFAGGTVTAWRWDFGDASAPSSLQNPDHTYGSSGIYNVVLHATGSNGCTGSATFPVQVYPLPIPSFTTPVTCENDTMFLSDLSMVSLGNIISWTWHIDDTVVSTLQNPSFTFSDLLLHSVKLIAVTDLGCSDSLYQFVHLSALPDPKIAEIDGCYPGSNSFLNTSTVNGGIIATMQWEFGDSTTANSFAPTHTYPGPGTYMVKLSVTTGDGCPASIIQPAHVWQRPSVDFIPDTVLGCQPLLVNFISQAASTDGDIASWQWDFGDGASDSTANVSAVFKESGTYSVSLVITSSYGCTDTAYYQNLVTVYPSPEAGFTYDPPSTDIYHPVISFQDASEAAVSWSWNFGDYSGSEELSPVHTYLDAGVYNVMHVVLSDMGCPDTVYSKVEIKPEYLYTIPNAFTPNGDGVNDYFIGQGIGVKEFSMYIFDRWGTKIYETTNQAAPWDGKYEDQPVQSDVYVYKIMLTDVFEFWHEFTGRVSLVR